MFHIPRSARPPAIRQKYYNHEVATSVWIVVKCFALGVLLLLLGAGGLIYWYVSSIADEDHERRCADVARGKEVVAALDSLVAASTTCPGRKMRVRAHAIGDDGQREKWDIDIDRTDCSYTLHKFTVPGWPIMASVRLEYDSRAKRWQTVCEGQHSTIRCP